MCSLLHTARPPTILSQSRCSPPPPCGSPGSPTPSALHCPLPAWPLNTHPPGIHLPACFNFPVSAAISSLPLLPVELPFFISLFFSPLLNHLISDLICHALSIFVPPAFFPASSAFFRKNSLNHVCFSVQKLQDFYTKFMKIPKIHIPLICQSS